MEASTHPTTTPAVAPVVPNIAGFPINRIVAFVGPYISLAAGVVATWLLTNIHLLGLFHLHSNGVASALAQGTVFVLTSVLTWVGQHKWLDGWQKWEQRVFPLL